MNNYDKLMWEEINRLEYTPNLLLHSCCGPCSTTCIERLKEHFNITILYYNPNIEPLAEYEKRKAEQIRLIKELGNIGFIDADYDNTEFRSIIKGLETEKEGGARCYNCFLLRLVKTARVAKENNFAYFATTLTVSPHKNSQIINEIGLNLAEEFAIKFLVSDFKKQNGYQKSVELAKKYNLYRQEYCGCLFSLAEKANFVKINN